MFSTVTKARRDQRRLFTVNVSNMETLFGYYNPQTGEDLGGRLNVWHELVKDAARLEQRFGIDDMPEVGYATGDGKARAIAFIDLEDLQHLLQDDAIAAAAARLVSYVRAHGQVPGCRDGGMTQPSPPGSWTRPTATRNEEQNCTETHAHLARRVS